MNGVAGVKRKRDIARKIRRHWQLYPVILIPFVLLIVFSYVPMAGILMAFENYRPTQGILGSEWVGLEHFRTFFETRQFKRLLLNTLGISVYSLAAGFPIPIILAMSLNQCGSARFKKVAQMITYADK